MRLTRRLSIVESLIQFYLPYQHLSNFHIWENFLKLEHKEFELFRKWYKKETRYLFGNKKFYRMRDFEDLDKKGDLPNIYQRQYLDNLRERLQQVANGPQSPDPNSSAPADKAPDKKQAKKKSKLFSEELQWKTNQVRNYLNKKQFIFNRLELQMGVVSQALSTLSKELLQMSELFRELDIQEDLISTKLSLGANWKAKSKKQAEDDPESKSSASAWKFGIKITKKWSLFIRSQKTIFEKQLETLTQGMWKEYQSLDKRLFKDQENINGDYMYRERNLRNEKLYLATKSPPEKWGLGDEWQGNQPLVESIRAGKRWAVDLLLPQKSRLFWHYTDYFRKSNQSSMLQLENFRMHVNCCYYKAFRGWVDWARESAFLVTQF